MKIWLTADDYGLDPDVNSAIEDLAAARRLSAVSVMTCEGMALDTAHRLPGDTVYTGLHLTFTQERPLTRDAALAPLLDGAGRFPPTPWGLAARLRPRCLPALRREAAAQLARFRALGLPLDFVCSHQHVHLVPPVWWALSSLLRALPGVALRQAGEQPLGLGRDGLLAAFSRICAAVRPVPGCPPLVPLGIAGSGHLNERALDRMLSPPPPPRTAARGAHWEIILHPAYERGPGLVRRYGHWRYAWEQERALLASGRAQAALNRHAAEMAAPERRSPHHRAADGPPTPSAATRNPRPGAAGD